MNDIEQLIISAMKTGGWHSDSNVAAMVGHLIPPHKAIRVATQRSHGKTFTTEYMAKAKRIYVQSHLYKLHDKGVVIRQGTKGAFVYAINRGGVQASVAQCRRLPKRQQIVGMLRTGPKAKSELEQVSRRVGSHVTRLRKAGYVINCDRGERDPIYTLIPQYTRGYCGWIVPASRARTKNSQQ